MENKGYKIIDSLCVNSKWYASFLAGTGTGSREACQCSFKCKVKVQNKDTGHIYIVDEEEFNQIRIDHPKHT